MTASDIPEPSAPPPPTYIRPNAHIRPLHLPHLDHYDPHSLDDSEHSPPPSPPPNHYQHHTYHPTSPPPPPPPPPSSYYPPLNDYPLPTPQHPHPYSSADTATTIPSTYSAQLPQEPVKPLKPNSPSPQPNPQPQQPAQSPLPKPAVTPDQSDGYPWCYILLGALLALFFNVFAFLFLCCPSGMGIHGRRRPSFVAGVVFGALINAAGIACIYYFGVRPLVKEFNVVDVTGWDGELVEGLGKLARTFASL